ncbi:universal stress protein [Massilia arenosa]|uniref:Universal stress protein n=1 Tax=Zemynaea arenosa TaxID=2561931 RepID=A0A4Y9SE54_9BURK|nr:universal stress protein [Massilia arenosa]TFW18949.1 universal stress protein [Massilia arenosa]
MFRHLLLPTDGSAAAGRALSDALQFARDAGARVTILHVVPEFHVFTYKTDMLEDTRAEFLRDSEAHATRLLEQAAAQARTAGVPCETRMARSDQPHEAITAAAREGGCDLIAMATHGLGGLRGMLIGSVTQKVLSTSLIPVLVYRTE